MVIYFYLMDKNPKNASVFLKWDRDPAVIFNDEQGQPVDAYFKSDPAGEWIKANVADVEHKGRVMDKARWLKVYHAYLK